MDKMKNMKGITLISLVVTIVVLLLLAAITINVTIGEDGIITQAVEARKTMEKAEAKERIQIEAIGGFNRKGKIIASEVISNIRENLPEAEIEGTVFPLYVTLNGYTFEVTGEPEVREIIANAPDISGFDTEKTYYVTWNLNEEETAYIPNAVNLKEIQDKGMDMLHNWYDYAEGKKQWANVKTTGGENDCYWVWIPRYAYKVPIKGNEAQTIDIVFLKGNGSTTNDIWDESRKAEIKASGGFKTEAIPGNWVIHPAFTNEGNGGFGELTGIWVAKYEASSSPASTRSNVTNLKVRVIPNVTSWNKITVGDIFTVCRNLTLAGNSLENTNNLNAHMMKNTEWGAVAYLSSSKYGKTDRSGNRVEVWNNPYSSTPITGLCGKGIDDKDLNTSDLNRTCKYNEIGGGNASTTGNVYGIYDMSGGTWEYVAGILNNSKSQGNNANHNNWYDFSNSALYPNKYFDWYEETAGDRNMNYETNHRRYGDAVYETSISGNPGTASWDKSDSWYPFPTSPVFTRGGHANRNNAAGIFAFGSDTGEIQEYYSFRPVVLSSEP